VLQLSSLYVLVTHKYHHFNKTSFE